jgi:phenylpropionate dioxygenase-like ring-hydroxylating dioxygenase large terminal subunit
MIPNQWYAVLDSAEVRPGKLTGVARMSEKLVFWRDSQGNLACLRDFCPHRGAALSIGKLNGDCIECPFHGFQFDASGQCHLIPANGRNASFPKQMKAGSYPTYETGGFIFIWWGEAQDKPPAPGFFTDLAGMNYATARVPWNTHYSRAIENQLDVAHLPFVHATTIGMSIGTLVDGPLTEWCGADRFRLYTFNRQDDGTPARRPEELSVAGKSFWLEFIYPNLWQNHLSEKARVVVAFAPVDDEHTLVYLRFYQNAIQIPIVKELFTHLAMPFNKRILRQDQRVVESQQPKRSELRLGEKLVQADRPIVIYRSRRQELIQAAQRTGSETPKPLR